MERSIKYLYYRGVRYATSLINRSATKIQQITYRGASLIRNTSDAVIASTAKKMYRGVAY